MCSSYSGLDSAFLYVKDLSEKDALSSLVTSDDNLPKVNTWLLQNVEKTDLLQQVLKPDDLEYTCAIIMLDLDQPWELMNSLTKWMGALQDTILAMKLPFQVQERIKNRLTTYVKTYEEPEVDENGKLLVKIKSDGKQNNEKNADLDNDDNDDDDNLNDLKT